MELKQLGRKDNFSVALGLTDYVNPIFYATTTILIFINLNTKMDKTTLIVYCVGAAISLIFGFTIPTVKLLVGLGKMKFKMPVNLVFYVNFGILLSGLMLMSFVFNINVVFVLAIIAVLLVVVLIKGKKINTVAVLTGAAGYLLVYCSLISLAVTSGRYLPIGFYGFAICLFVFLCLVGIKSDLKNARVHWVIEISNIVCQMMVAVGTVLLFY